jgi:hypothetical protein
MSDRGAPRCAALGRAIPAAGIPRMRIRQVWLHAAGLAARAGLAACRQG